MHYLRTEGSPRERGTAHGRQASDRIAWLIDHYRRGLMDGEGGWQEGADPETRRRAVDRLARRQQELHPTGCDEIEGIAEGAGLPFEDLFELNVIFEVGPSVHPAACSAYGFTDPEGRVWLGKTDDIESPEFGCNAVHWAAPSEGHRSVKMHYVGTIWTTSSVNEAGLCLGMTGLTGTSIHEDGIPTLFLIHAIAEGCRTVVEAEEMCAGFQLRSRGFSLLIGDATGDVAILEKHVAGQAIRRPAAPGDAIWQTNHCCDTSLAGADDPDSTLLENSRDRERFLDNADPTVERSFDGLQRLYRSHGRPAGVCQHGEGGLHTDSAIIMSPDERVMWMTEGYGCTNPFLRQEVV